MKVEYKCSSTRQGELVHSRPEDSVVQPPSHQTANNCRKMLCWDTGAVQERVRLLNRILRLYRTIPPLCELQQLSDVDIEVLLDTVNVLPVDQGGVGRLVVDQFAGVGVAPVLVPVDGQCPGTTQNIISLYNNVHVCTALLGPYLIRKSAQSNVNKTKSSNFATSVIYS